MSFDFYRKLSSSWALGHFPGQNIIKHLMNILGNIVCRKVEENPSNEPLWNIYQQQLASLYTEILNKDKNCTESWDKKD